MNTFNIFDTQRKEISGPINVLRLEGMVGSTEGPNEAKSKVVYIFFDDQSPITSQTECLNVHSIDVNKYIVNTFHKISTTDPDYICDFFVDSTPAQYRIDPVERARIQQTQGTAILRPTYEDQIVRLVQSANAYDPKSRRAQSSVLFKNVRLHYVDITEPLMKRIVETLAQAESVVRNSPSHSLAPIDPYAYVLLEQVKQEIALYTRIYQTILTRPSATIDEPHTQFARYLRKLLYGFKVPAVKRILTEYVHASFDQLSQLSKQIDETIKLFVTSVHDQENPPFTYTDGVYKYDIAKTRLDVESVGQRILDTHTLFIGSLQTVTELSDLYLLRRLLDKDYISHSVIYASREKGIHITRILVGDFDFKITNTAFTAITDMTKLNQTIRQRTRNNHAIADLLAYPGMSQCSDITDFPENFQ